MSRRETKQNHSRYLVTLYSSCHTIRRWVPTAAKRFVYLTVRTTAESSDPYELGSVDLELDRPHGRDELPAVPLQ